MKPNQNKGHSIHLSNLLKLEYLLHNLNSQQSNEKFRCHDIRKYDSTINSQVCFFFF